jgi:hypothetical protein
MIENSQNRNAVASGRCGVNCAGGTVLHVDPTLPRCGSDFEPAQPHISLE